MTERVAWLTLDEIIAAKVLRLRGERGWSIPDLARVLNVGRQVVHEMEGSREDRQQRGFKWTDLVALCGALETTLFELVLPDEGVSVAAVEDFPQMIPDEPSSTSVGHGVARRFATGGARDEIEGPRALSEPVVGRDGLSIRLFGGPVSNTKALDELIKRASEAKQRRDAQLEEMESDYLGEISRIHEEAKRIRAQNEWMSKEENIQLMDEQRKAAEEWMSKEEEE